MPTGSSTAMDPVSSSEGGADDSDERSESERDILAAFLGGLGEGGVEGGWEVGKSARRSPRSFTLLGLRRGFYAPRLSAIIHSCPFHGMISTRPRPCAYDHGPFLRFDTCLHLLRSSRVVKKRYITSCLCPKANKVASTRNHCNDKLYSFRDPKTWLLTRLSLKHLAIMGRTGVDDRLKHIASRTTWGCERFEHPRHAFRSRKRQRQRQRQRRGSCRERGPVNSI